MLVEQENKKNDQLQIASKRFTVEGLYEVKQKGTISQNPEYIKTLGRLPACRRVDSVSYHRGN